MYVEKSSTINMVEDSDSYGSLVVGKLCLFWGIPSTVSLETLLLLTLTGLLCIVANIAFFVNIFIILVHKLQAPHANEPEMFR